MRYFYLDESTFGPTRQYVAYGALVTDTQVPVSLVTTALANLRSDPDITDPKTNNGMTILWPEGTSMLSRTARTGIHICVHRSAKMYWVCSMPTTLILLIWIHNLIRKGRHTTCCHS